MRTIWKYKLDNKPEMMPEGSQFLDAQMQNGCMCVWFLVDTTKNMVNRDIRVYMTGEPLPDDNGKHVSTVQADGFVFHVFDFGENENKL